MEQTMVFYKHIVLLVIKNMKKLKFHLCYNFLQIVLTAFCLDNNWTIENYFCSRIAKICIHC